MPIANLQLVNHTEPDTLSRSYFMQAYFEMFNSAYNQAGWTLIDTLYNRISSNTVSGFYPIGLSVYTFNLIDTNAMANNLIQMHSDSLYYDTPGRATSPYNTATSFVATPLVDSIDAQTPVIFNFPSGLFINRSSLTISSILVDFNDGMGPVAVSVGQNHGVTYTTDGIKYLKFVVTMSNNAVYTTYGQVKVYNTASSGGGGLSSMSTMQPAAAAAASCNITSGKITVWSHDSFQGYDESVATQGKGEMVIYYATTGNCDGVVRKPIIVLDGFDPGDQNDIDHIYNEINIPNPTVGANFADYLRSQGYDIVILNFPGYYINGNGPWRDGGADYIERNAQVFITAVDMINGMKSGTEKNIVFGPSMGGLISRYGLAYMEQHNHLHNVKLWISFDSPHEGANVPLSDQLFLNYVAGDNSDAKTSRDNLINSKAAKQMLINHYLTVDKASGMFGPGGAPNFRDRFVSVMNTIGFPNGDAGQPFRKIALVDGSLGGNQLHAPCQTAFDFSSRFFAGFTFIFKVRMYGDRAAHCVAYFTPGAGSSCMNFIASALFHTPQTVLFTTLSYTSGYDTAPGGVAFTQQKIHDQADGQFSKKGFVKFRSFVTSEVGNHSFIPTKSALAFQGSNRDYSENISARNLVCTHETPFDSYYGSFSVNNTHVALWSSAADWLTKEIQGNPSSRLL